jgi:hypothetical protein
MTTGKASAIYAKKKSRVIEYWICPNQNHEVQVPYKKIGTLVILCT